MPDTVNGLPLHPLVVHAVVVLLPLATVGVIAIAVRPAWRARFGPVVIGLAALAAAAIPIATSTGDQLAGRVGVPHDHEELGDSLILFALPLLAAAVAVVWTNRTSSRAVLRRTVAALAVVVALANLVQVVRVGESGARAVWGTSTATGRR
ncbi:DUF2231 domain-containing protein [Dactylosporangium sucinum]|uniref:DUF2231 domain-containing protein n=1 Tax=Dactylosporangium sucinum TaxID=1424081 RepID=A0A917WZ32_9ACTN|nr:DUF2231 domain-containing protein [Dactylosporangium sucinum]GGM48200.1 hypothetical protein GCM10007977_057230 [Dactylosporangium sucinum]